MNINKHLLNLLTKKLKKEVKDETGYECNLVFKDPISLKIKDGAAKFNVNFEIGVDANLLLKLIEEIEE